MEKLNRFELNENVFFRKGLNIVSEKIVGIRINSEGEIEYLFKSNKKPDAHLTGQHSMKANFIPHEAWFSEEYLGRTKEELIEKIVEKLKNS